MSPPRPIIVVDTREQTPWRFSRDVDVVRATIPSGDYAIVAPDVPEYLTRRKRPKKKDAPPPAFPVLSASGSSEHVAVFEGPDGVVRYPLLPWRVERKASDFAASCTSDRPRFERELVRLGANFRPARVVLVVEYTFNEIEAGIYRSQASPQSLIASTVAIHHDYGITTHWGGSREECARWVERWLVMALERHVEATREELAERDAIAQET